MLQGWERITFLHWRFEPERIGSLLPRGLEPDLFEGAAWVGLTPFEVTGLRPPGWPALPWISRFPEMNLRTYVRGSDGERGIWFFSLEADRIAAVLGARLGYGLPYRWARMRLRENDGVIEYSSRRHFASAEALIGIRPGLPIRAGPREIFLTARFRLYAILAGRLAYAQVEHPPWPLRSAEILQLRQNIFEQSGLPCVSGAPLVHFSPGVQSRIGWPTFVR